MRLQGGRLFGAGLAVLATASALVGVVGVTPASAGTITTPTFSSSSLAATATQVTWTIGFISPSALAAGTDTLTVTGPTATTFPTSQGSYVVTDDTTAASASPSVAPSVSNSNSVPSTTQITMPVSAQAGDQVFLQIRGTTNPAVGASQTISVQSSKDAAGSATASFVAPVAPTLNSFVPNTTSGGATQATWNIDLNTSATNGQLWPGFGQLVVSDPSFSTIFSGATSNYTITDVTTGSAGPAGKVAVTNDGTTVDKVVVTPNIPVGAGDEVVLQLRGVTNPPASTTYAQYLVSTSSDSVNASPGAGSFGAAGNVTYSKLTTSTTAAGATKATWQASYVASSTGGLWPAHGAITMTLTGATFSSFAGNYTVTDITTGTSNNATGAAVSAGSVKITVSNQINPGDTVSVQARGVTNPASLGAVTSTLKTTSEPTAQSAGSVPTLVSAHTLGGAPSFNTNTPAENATHVTWTFKANASSTGKLWNGQGGFVIALPAAATPPTVFSSNPADYQVTDTTLGLSGVSSSVTRTLGTGSVGASVVVTTPFTINSGDRFTLRARNVTNPGDTTAFSSVSFTTTSDTGGPPVLTVGPGTNFVASSPLGLTSFTPSSSVGGASGVTWTVALATSGSGQLWAGYGQITLTMPTNGTVGLFSANKADYTVSYNGVTLAPSNLSVSSSSGTEKVVLTVPMAIGKNGAVTVVLHNVKNPVSTTAFSTIGISTSSDTVVHPGAGSFS